MSRLEAQTDALLGEASLHPPARDAGTERESGGWQADSVPTATAEQREFVLVARDDGLHAAVILGDLFKVGEVDGSHTRRFARMMDEQECPQPGIVRQQPIQPSQLAGPHLPTCFTRVYQRVQHDEPDWWLVDDGSNPTGFGIQMQG